MQKKIIIIIIIIALFSFLLSGPRQAIINNIRTKALTVFSPALKFSRFISRQIADFRDVHFLSEKLSLECNRLTEVNLHLQQQIGSIGTVIDENKRLRGLLGFKEKTNNRYIAARVIGRDPSVWFESIIIDKGSKDSLTEGLSVVNSQGLVGYISHLTKSSSRITLLIDRKHSFGVRIEDVGELAVANGTNSQKLHLSYISRNAQIPLNSEIFSSGLGQIYPKNLPIGTVVEVFSAPNALYKEAYVKPHVEFSKLEEVLVLISDEHR